MLNKSYFEDLMYGRAKSLLWGPLLSVLAWGYGALIRLRRAFYAVRIAKSKRLPCPVISIGNITLGGTGKTPTVISIASFLLSSRKRPIILSRGYGRKNEKKILLVSDGRSVLVGPEDGGDEPVLIGSKLYGVPILVGQNRYQAGMEALLRFKPDVVILDDGYQHIQLQRTLDIVLVDAYDPFGNGRLFPAGILREPIAALDRADAVLITRADQAEEAARLKERIARNTRGRIFTSRFIPLALVDCRSGDSRPLSCLRGGKVLAFAGIARPSYFAEMLASLGASVAAESRYPDHFQFRKNDLAALYKKAADHKVDFIMTTEKDAVRFKHLDAKGIFALRIELCVDEREAWESFLLNRINGVK